MSAGWHPTPAIVGWSTPTMRKSTSFITNTPRSMGETTEVAEGSSCLHSQRY